jgi:crotonobetaine/carnitine-CoA ligase
MAGYLQSLGTASGDRVAVMMSNRQELLWAHFGCSFAGAASVLVSTDLKGPILTHMLSQSAPRLVLAERRYVETIEAAIAGLEPRPAIVAFESTDENELTLAIGAGDHGRFVNTELWDLATILYTSGTTGRSKGVMMSNGAAFNFAESVERSISLTSSDVAYSCLPLFHNNALSVTLMPAVRTRSTAVFGPRFSASRFWSEVRDSGATVISLLGSMVPILWNRDEEASDRDHQVRIAMTVPAPTTTFDDFQERFGFRFASLYGMTDVGLPILTPPEEARPGCAGVQQPDWECRIVDGNDYELPDGEAGELIVRPRRPHIMPLGYYSDAAATADAWGGLWFHTGDLMMRDSVGWFHFVDRKKDAMRRFGENISSFEVESVLESHPDVAEAAAFAVPSELSEDEVMVAVVLTAGSTITAGELWDHCDGLLPYFAVPRYIDIRLALPKTSTAKVQKAVLRAEGVTGTTRDRGPTGRGFRKI